MLLIGFVWVLLPTFIATFIKVFVPGRWEDHGPTIMVVSGAGASMTAITGMLVLEGFNSYGPPSTAEASIGVGLSLLGGLGATAAYAMDARRHKRA